MVYFNFSGDCVITKILKILLNTFLKNLKNVSKISSNLEKAGENLFLMNDMEMTNILYQFDIGTNFSSGDGYADGSVSEETSISINFSTSPPRPPPRPAPVNTTLLASVLGSVAFVCISAIIIVWLIRRERKNKSQ